MKRQQRETVVFALFVQVMFQPQSPSDSLESYDRERQKRGTAAAFRQATQLPQTQKRLHS